MKEEVSKLSQLHYKFYLMDVDVALNFARADITMTLHVSCPVLKTSVAQIHKGTIEFAMWYR